MPYATGRLVVALILAATLYGWTIQGFDRSMGRMKIGKVERSRPELPSQIGPGADEVHNPTQYDSVEARTVMSAHLAASWRQWFALRPPDEP